VCGGWGKSIFNPRDGGNGAESKTVQQMENLSIDPGISPNFPIEEQNPSDGGRTSVNHGIPAQPELRKETVEKADFPSQVSQQGELNAPAFSTSLPREAFSDITNLDNGLVSNGPIQKSWKRISNNSVKTSSGPIKNLPQKRNGADENWVIAEDIQSKKQAVQVDHDPLDFLAVSGFQHRQSQ
jgi:hypothetical protein